MNQIHTDNLLNQNVKYRNGDFDSRGIIRGIYLSENGFPMVIIENRSGERKNLVTCEVSDVTMGW